MYDFDEKVLFAWYSEKQRKVAGTYFYLLLDGRTVEGTMVSSNSTHLGLEKSGVKWDDMVLLGQIVEFVRKGEPSSSSWWLGKDEPQFTRHRSLTKTTK